MKININRNGTTKSTIIEGNSKTAILGQDVIINPNLIKYSAGFSSHTPYNSVWTVNDSLLTSTRNSSNSTSYLCLTNEAVNGTIIAGVKTISGYIKVNGKIPASKYFTGLASTYGNTLVSSIYDNKTGFFAITQTYVSSSTWILHAPCSESNSSGSVVTIDKLKLEEGTKATPWIPHIDDFPTGNNTYKNAIKCNEIYEY